MDKTTALNLMKAPGDRRPGIWRGRVLQIKVTNICDLSCNNCTAAVPQIKGHKMYWQMTPEQFRTAVESLVGFPGVIGLFGGNPCTSKHFEEICAIFREVIPNIEQRGLWSNNLMGKAAICRETFHPAHSNLNVHRVDKAFQEMQRDWPEAVAARQQMMQAGHKEPSLHGSWWNAMRDVIPDEGKRWDLISKCFVNQTWSAEITVIAGQLKAFFCEFAATRAEFAGILGEKPTGMEVAPGWWTKPIQDFEEQICHHCHSCGAPLNPHKIEDMGSGPEDYTQTNAAIFEPLKRPSRLVKTYDEIQAGEGAATAYLGDVVLAHK